MNTVCDPLRLAALRRLQLPNAGVTEASHRLTRLAARFLHAPASVISLVEEDHQIVLGSCGLPDELAAMPRILPTHSYCWHVVEERAPFVVEDAREGPLSRQHGALLDLGLVAYLGIPLTTTDGHVLGTFAVIDTKPRPWRVEEIGLLRDLAASAITEIELRRALVEQIEREQQLRRVERLAGVGTLIGGVAHELNNPLSAVLNFAQFLASDERDAERRSDLLTIQREAERMAKIVSDLRQIAQSSRQEAPDRAPIDLNEVVEHVLKVQEYRLRTSGVRVRADLAEDLPPVHADRGQMEQVVTNLVVNAMQAIASTAREGRLIIRTRASAKGVALQVVDDGPGIPPHLLQRLFDPFFTTKSPGEGTGLGLSLVHGILRDHGGEIDVDSQVGAGAAFRVDLPRGEALARPPVPDPQDPATRSLRILIVDDEASIRRALVRHLGRRGHVVDEAADGHAALQLLDRHEYDAILSDVRMPGMGGAALLEELRGRDLADRLILVTGDIASAGATLRDLANPLLLKPVRLQAVTRAIEEVGTRPR